MSSLVLILELGVLRQERIIRMKNIREKKRIVVLPVNVFSP